MTTYTAAVQRVIEARTLADYHAARLVMQQAWNDALRAMLPVPEPCSRLCAGATYRQNGCLYPCACKIVNE